MFLLSKASPMLGQGRERKRWWRVLCYFFHGWFVVGFFGGGGKKSVTRGFDYLELFLSFSGMCAWTEVWFFFSFIFPFSKRDECLCLCRRQELFVDPMVVDCLFRSFLKVGGGWNKYHSYLGLRRLFVWCVVSFLSTTWRSVLSWAVAIVCNKCMLETEAKYCWSKRKRVGKGVGRRWLIWKM